MAALLFSSSASGQPRAVQSKCLACHGEQKISGLDLRDRASALKGGTRGPALAPGDADRSLIYRHASGMVHFPHASLRPDASVSGISTHDATNCRGLAAVSGAAGIGPRAHFPNDTRRVRPESASRLARPGARRPLVARGLQRPSLSDVLHRHFPHHPRFRRRDLNNAASPATACDSKGVVVFFADFGLAEWTRDGKRGWQVPLEPLANVHGMASSPVLWKNLVLCLQGSDTGSRVQAFERGSGKPVWSDTLECDLLDPWRHSGGRVARTLHR